MPIAIVTDPMLQAALADCVACHRVADLPVPRREGCLQQQCADCGAAIWVAPTSPKAPRKICAACVGDLSDGNTLVLMTPATARRFGI